MSPSGASPGEAPLAPLENVPLAPHCTMGVGGPARFFVEAADEHEIRARFGEDPWASMELLNIGVIEPWALWLDGRAE